MAQGRTPDSEVAWSRSIRIDPTPEERDKFKLSSLITDHACGFHWKQHDGKYSGIGLEVRRAV
jgi:hypothetical protein